MTTIVEALRERARNGHGHDLENDTVPTPLTLLEWAASLIEDKDAEIERLQAALDIARSGLLRIEQGAESTRASVTRALEQRAPETLLQKGSYLLSGTI